MNDTTKKVLAEFLGTFTLIFIGAGAGALDHGLLAVAFAHGLAVMTSVYAWGSISGCHINPAVTFGLLVTGRIDVPKAVLYWVAQFAGGIAAAYLLLYLLGDQNVGNLGQTTGTLTAAFPVKVIILEAVMTFFLLIAVFASGVGGRSGNAAGFAIGMVVTMDILLGGPLTGASLNPARTLGPALAMGKLDYVWMYFVGPLAGAAAAALLYNNLFLPAELKPPVVAAQTKATSRVR
jgi:MIP family channel proteins